MLALSFKPGKYYLISKSNIADITTGCHNAASSSEKMGFSLQSLGDLHFSVVWVNWHSLQLLQIVVFLQANLEDNVFIKC